MKIRKRKKEIQPRNTTHSSSYTWNDSISETLINEHKSSTVLLYLWEKSTRNRLPTVVTVTKSQKENYYHRILPNKNSEKRQQSIDMYL